MKSTKLLTLLSIGIASWTHSCIEKKKTNEKEVTAATCKDKQMKFDETNKKCVSPDEAFCSGLNLGFKESPPTCIAKDGTGTDTGTGGNGSTADAGITIDWDEAGTKPPTTASSVTNLAGKILLKPQPLNTPFEIRIWVKGSNCTIETSPPNPSEGSIEVKAGAPTGTKECKMVVLANNLKTNTHAVKDITIEFN